MTRTIETAQLRNISIAVLFMAMAFFAFASNASANLSGNGSNYSSHDIKGSGGHADSKGNWTSGGGERGGGGNSPTGYDGAGITDGPGGGSYGVGADGKGKAMSSEARLLLLKQKFGELESKKNELMRKIDELRGGASSTKPNGNNGDARKRICDPAPGSNYGSSTNQLANDIRKRLCDRWDHGTSTPSTPKPRASSTPMVKVLTPNGGEAYKHRNGAVVIRWKNTTADKTVDIDLEKNGSTTSIAKDVKGNAINQMSNRDNKGGSGPRGAERCSSSGAKTWEKACGPAFSYRFKEAALGTGYKVIVTAKVGDTTYSDKSDGEFSIVAAPKGAKENARMSSDAHEDGDVLGATTSLADEITNSYNQLEDELAMMSLELSSQ